MPDVSVRKDRLGKGNFFRPRLDLRQNKNPLVSKSLADFLSKLPMGLNKTESESKLEYLKVKKGGILCTIWYFWA